MTLGAWLRIAHLGLYFIRKIFTILEFCSQPELTFINSLVLSTLGISRNLVLSQVILCNPLASGYDFLDNSKTLRPQHELTLHRAQICKVWMLFCPVRLISRRAHPLGYIPHVSMWFGLYLKLMISSTHCHLVSEPSSS